MTYEYLDVEPCPGCGWAPLGNSPAPERFNASAGCWSAFGELCVHTLSATSTDFIHQTAVDAYAAQHCREHDTRRLVFALLGLQLVLQEGRTGAQVQRVHHVLARDRHPLPEIHPLQATAVGSAGDALETVARSGVQSAVTSWAEQVWTVYSPVHDRLIAWMQDWPPSALAAARRPVR